MSDDLLGACPKCGVEIPRYAPRCGKCNAVIPDWHWSPRSAPPPGLRQQKPTSISEALRMDAAESARLRQERRASEQSRVSRLPAWSEPSRIEMLPVRPSKVPLVALLIVLLVAVVGSVVLLKAADDRAPVGVAVECPFACRVSWEQAGRPGAETTWISSCVRGCLRPERPPGGTGRKAGTGATVAVRSGTEATAEKPR